MRHDRIRIAERVEKDWSNLSEEERSLVTEAFGTLDNDPIAGVPLFEPLGGYWSYRSRWLRIIYKIAAEARLILILKIARVAEPES